MINAVFMDRLLCRNWPLVETSTNLGKWLSEMETLLLSPGVGRSLSFSLLTLISNLFITHTDSIRVSKAIICACLCGFVCLCVCPHDKTKPAESTITKLGTGIVHHDISPTSEWILGQRSGSHGHKMHKGDSVADISYAVCRVSILLLSSRLLSLALVFGVSCVYLWVSCIYLCFCWFVLSVP